MLDIFAGFDILGAGTLIGSLLFLGALVWVLVDDRSFDEVSRRHAAEVERERPIPAPRVATAQRAPTTATAEGAEARSPSPRTADARSDRPPHPRRVA